MSDELDKAYEDIDALRQTVDILKMKLAAAERGDALDDDDPTWAAWWRMQAEDEIEMMRPKVTDYGAVDLAWIGHQMAQNQGRQVDDEEAAELGIYWYSLGKLGRWTAAVREGRRPSDDTIQDLVVYGRMCLYVREHGRWP
jgi:hypothetical protein